MSASRLGSGTVSRSNDEGWTQVRERVATSGRLVNHSNGAKGRQQRIWSSALSVADVDLTDISEPPCDSTAGVRDVQEHGRLRKDPDAWLRDGARSG